MSVNSFNSFERNMKTLYYFIALFVLVIWMAGSSAIEADAGGAGHAGSGYQEDPLASVGNPCTCCGQIGHNCKEGHYNHENIPHIL
ncbi:hypothetical protein Ocin01_07415 [Orchesella cincta]|uniref:Uncharacterized protein n=1 Tax=Orchesella cincta TaxID=48709 RepID=A0A1D2N1X7_ORCCI|nr:hypothetical protein Ocin01_07415 [Orchesella cincta]